MRSIVSSCSWQCLTWCVALWAKCWRIDISMSRVVVKNAKCNCEHWLSLICVNMFIKDEHYGVNRKELRCWLENTCHIPLWVLVKTPGIVGVTNVQFNIPLWGHSRGIIPLWVVIWVDMETIVAMSRCSAMIEKEHLPFEVFWLHTVDKSRTTSCLWSGHPFHHNAESIEDSVPILLAMRLLLREVNEVKSKKIGTLNITLFATQIVVKMHVIVAAANKRSFYHLW